MSNNEEIEINLVEMFRVIFRKFKYCVISGIIVALALGGYKGYSTYKNVNDPNLVTNAETELKTAMEEYENTQKELKESIASLEVQIAEQQEYLENSLKMQLNPYAVSTSRTEYYIDAHYQINPNLTYQNTDKTNTVVNMYKLLLQSGDFYSYIKDKMNFTTNEMYVNEIVTFSNVGNGIISVTAYYDNETDAKAISDYTYEYLLAHKAQIDDVADHDLSVFSSTLFTEVKNDFLTYQTNQRNSLDTKTIDKANKEEELADLKEPTMKDIDKSGVIKNSIKFGIIGFFVGGVLLGMIYAFGYLFNTKVCNEKELYDRYHVRVFGSVNVK